MVTNSLLCNRQNSTVGQICKPCIGDGIVTMKFIHIADVHLGALPDKGYAWSEQRRKEIFTTFCDIIDVCRREKPDLLLIAGDLFHAQPLVRELREVDALFASIPSTRVVIIAGNHDYISGTSHYVGFEWSDNVTFFDSEEVESIRFEDINTCIYGLSFCHRQIGEPLLDDVMPVDRGCLNILLMHGGVAESLPIDKNRLLGAGFDYIACGHIHLPQFIADRMIYPGDIEPLDRNDVGERGFIAGELVKTSEGSSLATRFVPCSRRMYFKPELEVDASIMQSQLRSMVRDAISEYGEQNIFTFTITGRRDRDTQFDCEALLEEGNITEIVDKTVPDYDFERLKLENKGNIIGRFIEAMESSTVDEETKRRALDYGISALLRD